MTRFGKTEPWAVFEDGRPNKNKTSSDMGSVPDPTVTTFLRFPASSRAVSILRLEGAAEFRSLE